MKEYFRKPCNLFYESAQDSVHHYSLLPAALQKAPAPSQSIVSCMLMDQGHRHVWGDARILGIAAPFRLYCTPGCWPAMTEPAKAMVEYVRLIVAAARLASVKELKLGHCPPAFISAALIITILQL